MDRFNGNYIFSEEKKKWKKKNATNMGLKQQTHSAVIDNLSELNMINCIEYKCEHVIRHINLKPRHTRPSIPSFMYKNEKKKTNHKYL